MEVPAAFPAGPAFRVPARPAAASAGQHLVSQVPANHRPAVLHPAVLHPAVARHLPAVCHLPAAYLVLACLVPAAYLHRVSHLRVSHHLVHPVKAVLVGAVYPVNRRLLSHRRLNHHRVSHEVQAVCRRRLLPRAAWLVPSQLQAAVNQAPASHDRHRVNRLPVNRHRVFRGQHPVNQAPVSRGQHPVNQVPVSRGQHPVRPVHPPAVSHDQHPAFHDQHQVCPVRQVSHRRVSHLLAV